jgi:hypothetical protein
MVKETSVEKRTSTTPKLMEMLDLSIAQPIDVKTTFWQVSYIELMQVEELVQKPARYEFIAHMNLPP